MAREQDKQDGATALTQLQQEVFLYYQEPIDLLNAPDVSDTKTNVFALYSNNRYSFLYLSRNDKPPEFLS